MLLMRFVCAQRRCPLCSSTSLMGKGTKYKFQTLSQHRGLGKGSDPVRINFELVWCSQSLYQTAMLGTDLGTWPCQISTAHIIVVVNSLLNRI